MSSNPLAGATGAALASNPPNGDTPMLEQRHELGERIVCGTR